MMILNIYKCKDGKIYNNRQAYINHLRHVYQNLSFEQVYLIEKQASKKICKCGEECKFISITKGYTNTCNKKACIRDFGFEKTKIWKKNLLKQNSELCEYDAFIKDNYVYYKDNFFKRKAIDIYDNTNSGNITLRSFILLKYPDFNNFFIYEKCHHCGIIYEKPIFKRNSIYNLCSKRCISSFTKYRDFLGTISFGYSVEYILKYYNDLDLYSFTNDAYAGKIDWNTLYLLYLSGFYFNKRSILLNLSNINIVSNSYFNYFKINGKDVFDTFYNGTLANKIVFTKKCLMCNKKIKSHRTFCSHDCYNEAKRKKMYVQYISPESSIMRSNKLKEKIASGKWTPCVTNSRCKSRIVIDSISVRSSWEAAFYYIQKYILKKDDIKYEFDRIQYYICEKSHTYITDFRIQDTIYEIKPSALINDEVILIKLKALNLYCEQHNLKYVIISESWFKTYITKAILEKIAEHCDITYNTVFRRLKQFIKKE